MNRVLVIGLGTFGATIADALIAKGAEVIAVESNEAIMNKLAVRIPDIRAIDPGDPAWLDAIDPDSVDHAIVCIGNLEQSILMTLQLVDRGIGEIHARASSDSHRKILLSLGIKNVIFPERDAALGLAGRITAPHIQSIVRLAEDKLMADFDAPSSFVGKTLVELNLRAHYQVLVIAIRRRHARIDSVTREKIFVERFIDAPPPNEPIRSGDVLVLVGTEENINSLIESHRTDTEDEP